MAAAPQKRLLNQLGGPFLVSVVLVLIILAVSTAIAYQSERREMRRVPETIALGAADGISSFFGFLEDTLLLAQGVYEHQGDVDENGRRLLQAIVDQNITLLELRLYDEEGSQVSRISDAVLSEPVIPEDQFWPQTYVSDIVQKKTSRIFDPELSQYNTSFVVWGFPVSIPATGEEYVMLAFIDISSLWGVLAEINQTRPGNFYIVDEAGDMLVASSFDLIPEEENISSIQVVRDFLEGRKGTRVYEGLSNEEVFGTWEVLPPTTWALVVEFPSSELARDISRSLVVSIIFLVVLITFFAYEAVIVRRVLLKPLDLLVGIIKGFKAGNLRDRVSGFPENELGDLAQTFNHMADELEASYTGLEQKVAEKTKELRQVLEQVEQQARDLEADKVQDQAVFDSVGDGLVFMDKERRVVNMNKTAVKLLGGTLGDYQGQSWPEVVSLAKSNGEPVEHPEVPVVQALERQETVNVLPVLSDLAFRDKSGNYFPVSMTVAPVLLEGRVIGAVVAFRNVTAEKEIDRQKNEFISFASHQLRTPLTNIKWVSELLLKGAYDPLTPKQEQAVLKLDHVVKQMIGLVAALLNLSRIELGTVVTKPEPVDVQALITEVISEFEVEIKGKNLQLVQDIMRAPQDFLTDGKLLQIVVQNLVSNAIKYTENGSITVVAKASEDGLQIEVQDTGYGIPKSSHDKIFTKLYRARNISQKVAGTGLGLYMAHSIVALLGGAITFTSEEDKGSNFVVTLPEITQAEKQKEIIY